MLSDVGLAPLSLASCDSADVSSSGPNFGAPENPIINLHPTPPCLEFTFTFSALHATLHGRTFPLVAYISLSPLPPPPPSPVIRRLYTELATSAPPLTQPPLPPPSSPAPFFSPPLFSISGWLLRTAQVFLDRAVPIRTADAWRIWSSPS